MKQPAETTSLSTHTSLIVALVASILIGIYPHVRYGGRLSGGGDAQRFTAWIASMKRSASIVPNTAAYPNGYGYQFLALISDYVSGIGLESFQLYLGTLLIAWTIFIAWLFYRQITQSAVGASMATFILLLQPELLFGLLRGTHEKFTRGLMFLCLFLLAQSLLSRRQRRRFAAFLLAFYLAVFALIAFNSLLATSFIIALALCLALHLIVRQLAGGTNDGSVAVSRRLLYATVVALVLAFLFTFYAYAPARRGILLAETVVDRLALLLLHVGEASVNPYQALTGTWISLPVYFIVSIANWLLLIVSFALWSTQTFTWWHNRTWPDDPRAFLLWSLYGAFAILGALSIAVDVSGAIAANLQHRIFPSFAMIAAAVVADHFVRRQARRPVVRPLAYGVLAVSIALLGLVAVAKATNEPSLSNKWQYYAPAELMALEWSRAANPDGPTWTSFDERLRAAVGICCAQEFESAELDVSQPDPATRDFLLSDVIRARSTRLNLSLPIEEDSLRVYDNGRAEIYHLRPQSPYQR